MKISQLLKKAHFEITVKIQNYIKYTNWSFFVLINLEISHLYEKYVFRENWFLLRLNYHHKALILLNKIINNYLFNYLIVSLSKLKKQHV